MSWQSHSTVHHHRQLCDNNHGQSPPPQSPPPPNYLRRLRQPRWRQLELKRERPPFTRLLAPSLPPPPRIVVAFPGATRRGSSEVAASASVSVNDPPRRTFQPLVAVAGAQQGRNHRLGRASQATTSKPPQLSPPRERLRRKRERVLRHPLDRVVLPGHGYQPPSLPCLPLCRGQEQVVLSHPLLAQRHRHGTDLPCGRRRAADLLVSRAVVAPPPPQPQQNTSHHRSGHGHRLAWRPPAVPTGPPETPPTQPPPHSPLLN